MASTGESAAQRGIGGLRSGVWLLAEGMGLLRRERSLWLLASIPVGLAVLALATATSLFWLELDTVHAAFDALLPTLEVTAWWSWLWVGPARAGVFILSWLGVLVSFALSLVAALLVANLLSAPVLDLLSQRVERLVRGFVEGEQAEGKSSFVLEIAKSFAAELQRLAFLASLWIVLSFLGFIVPGGQIVTGPLLVAITILFLPLDYAGFALDRRGVSFGGRRRWLRRHLLMMSGFGGVAFLACLVPGLNLIAMPTLVTAGTLLVLRTDPREAELRDPEGGGRSRR